MQFFNNGFVIQEISEASDKPYKGIEGNNWFFYIQNAEIEAIYNKKIGDRAWADDHYLECFNYMPFLSDCIKYCLNTDQKFRVLFCRTELPEPEVSLHKNMRLKFLGYDYAFPSGYFYSCVQNDLVLRTFLEFDGIQLNSKGLLKDRQQLEHFLEIRKELCKIYPYCTFEEGEITAYMLYELVNYEVLLG